MTKDPKAQPRGATRAAKLRKKIDALTEDREIPAAEKGAGKPMSPREFIQKRMAELDKKK